MKRFLKVIVPLLLAVAILFSIGWYLLEYDPEFTRDLLLSQARLMEKNGNMTAAVWFYDLAYAQSIENDHVAIELAEKFKALGNYTKAEYTLSKAIEDGGTVPLYTALCKTYVEQNKLMDAVQMLDKISNPEMKQQLDALRPEAPTVSLEPGHYSQYLTVTVDVTSGWLFATTDGEFPSIREDYYREPITLTQGRNTILALCITDGGLVSPLASFTYTVDGVIEEVTFQDPAVEDAVRTQLEVRPGTPLMSSDLWMITEFTLPSGAVSCQDLRWMKNLEKLTIENNVLDSLESLSGMQKLSQVTITGCILSTQELAIIGKLPALARLDLSGCSLSSIDGLENAVNLQYLDLSDNNIRNIDALMGLRKLETLDLSHNAVVSLEQISQLSSLHALDVSYNSVVTTAPLQNLSGLTALYLNGNGLMQLEGFEALTGLKILEAGENKLVDISVLSGCTQLERLNVANNTLLDLSVVSNFGSLRELLFAYNEVEVLPRFAPGTPLVTVDGSHNHISSLEPLTGMQFLEYVMMDYNGGISNLGPLANCPSLKLVNVYRTCVTSVSVLTDLGVIVNFKPI